MKDLPIFAGLTAAELELIISAAREKHFSEGEIIFKEGSLVREVAMLLSGSVELTVFGSLGIELTLEAIAPGWLVELNHPGASHYRTAQAVEACWTLVWDVAEFRKLLVRIPTFRTNVFKALRNRMEEMQRKLCEQRKKLTSEHKLRMKLISDDMRRRADPIMALYATLGLIALGVWAILQHAYK